MHTFSTSVGQRRARFQGKQAVDFDACCGCYLCSTPLLDIKTTSRNAPTESTRYLWTSINLKLEANLNACARLARQIKT